MTLKNIQSTKLLWKDLGTSPKELHLDTLKCGQTFRWFNTNDQWSCVLKGKLCVLRQTPSTVLYGVSDEEEEGEMKSVLRDYFQLDRVSLEASYKRWSAKDKNFEKKAIHFQGIRILRQDPWENLVSFICSSNNNISRISQMVQKLCVRYGSPVASLDGIVHHAFPPVNILAQEDVEQTLRELGFGYRAKYIAQTATQVLGHEEGWLTGLRQVPYPEAKKALMTLAGVGPKVADCVCLMSLDHAESIPVDTHVWQIALRDYGFAKKAGKTLTAKLYDEVADHFRGIFGEYSGWAHSVLFTADLKSFEDRVIKMTTSKVAVKEEEQNDSNAKVVVKKIKATVVEKRKMGPLSDENPVLRRSPRTRRA